jgi:hypothetical protein
MDTVQIISKHGECKYICGNTQEIVCYLVTDRENIWKKERGNTGPHFYSPNVTIKDRNPGFLGGFGWGGVRLRLGHGKRKKERG